MTTDIITTETTNLTVSHRTVLYSRHLPYYGSNIMTVMQLLVLLHAALLFSFRPSNC